MQDTLMLSFVKQQTDASYSNWRMHCIDHGEQTGSFPEFLGRLKRCHQALARRNGRVVTRAR